MRDQNTQKSPCRCTPAQTFRLERVLFDKIVHAEPRKGAGLVETFSELVLDALFDRDELSFGPRLVPEICERPNPPQWCHRVAEFRTPLDIVLAGLVASKVLDARQASAVRGGREGSLHALSPALLRAAALSEHVPVTSEDALEVLDGLTRLNALFPDTDGRWDRLCRKQPTPPICRLILQGLADLPRRPMLEVATVSTLHHLELLSESHTLASLNAMYEAWVVPRSRDMNWRAAMALLEFAGLSKEVAETALLDAQTGELGLLLEGEPDRYPWGPWIRNNRVAAGVVCALIKNKVLDREAANDALAVGVIIVRG